MNGFCVLARENFLPNLLNIHFDETGEFYLGRVGDVTKDSGILVGSLVKNHVSEDVLKVGDDNFLPAFGGQQLAKLLQNNVRNVVAFVSYQARNEESLSGQWTSFQFNM